ncbi:MAG: flagellar motor switch protein FliM, partial [Desulforhopalus sp.]
VLNKLEIAELLNAIRTGRVTLDPAGSGSEDFLPCTPVDIFSLPRPRRRHLTIPNFEVILDNFCQISGRSLTNQLQRPSSITRAAVDIYEFQKFISSKPTSGVIGMLDMHPLKQAALILFDTKLAFSMLEMMLGASAGLDSVVMDRNLTTLELNILETVILDLCKDLDRTFSPLVEMHTSLVRFENLSRLVSMIDPDDEVVVGSFLVKAVEYSGEIHLIFPSAALEPLRQPLRDLLNVSTVAQNGWQGVLENEILDIVTDITALSGTIAVTVQKVLQMRKGDILTIDYDPDGPVKILVENKPKFTAIPGNLKGTKAISLTGII